MVAFLMSVSVGHIPLLNNQANCHTNLRLGTHDNWFAWNMGNHLWLAIGNDGLFTQAHDQTRFKVVQDQHIEERHIGFNDGWIAFVKHWLLHPGWWPGCAHCVAAGILERMAEAMVGNYHSVSIVNLTHRLSGAQ